MAIHLLKLIISTSIPLYSPGGNTCHDDVEDAGVDLDPHDVGGRAHDGPEVHGGEGGVAQHAAGPVVHAPAHGNLGREGQGGNSKRRHIYESKRSVTK